MPPDPQATAAPEIPTVLVDHGPPYSRGRPSPAYLEGVARSCHHHATAKTFTGRRSMQCYPELKAFFAEHRPATMLDYGSGKGVQYALPEGYHIHGEPIRHLGEALGVEVTRYDPAVPGIDELPAGTYDAVLVVDVLGYVPTPDIPWVLDEVFGFATKCVFVNAGVMRPEKLGMDALDPDWARWAAWWKASLAHASALRPGVDWMLRLKHGVKNWHLYRRHGDWVREVPVPLPVTGVGDVDRSQDRPADPPGGGGEAEQPGRPE